MYTHVQVCPVVARIYCTMQLLGYSDLNLLGVASRIQWGQILAPPLSPLPQPTLTVVVTTAGLLWLEWL